jgi:hypothetical protein
VSVAAPARVRALEPLARFASTLTAYGDPESDQPTTTAWSLRVPGGRVTITLSPDRTRGFSGEGGQLMDLVSAVTADAAVSLERSLDGRHRFTVAEAAEASGAPADTIRAQLTWLGIHGHLGFDVADREFFRRHLPYPEDALRREPPRLRDARMLVENGAVMTLGDGSTRVTSGEREYRVLVDGASYRCTCPWVAKHGTARGPCKHVLASAIARDSRSAP